MGVVVSGTSLGPRWGLSAVDSRKKTLPNPGHTSGTRADRSASALGGPTNGAVDPDESFDGVATDQRYFLLIHNRTPVAAL